LKYLLTLLFLLLASVSLLASHNESTDGDLSDDPLAPTVVSVVAGSNVVTASSVSGDVEYFTITIPVGHELTALNLVSLTSANVAFLAFQAGATFSSNPGPEDLLGFTHLGVVTGDQLPALAAGLAGSPSPIGFTNPLPAGTYTFWAQETASSPSSYELDFVIAEVAAAGPAVPTMSQWSIMILGIIMLIVTTVGLRQRHTTLSL